MRLLACLLLSLSFAPLAGCGESSNAPPGPTGGKFPLPNEKGFFEIATEGRPAGRGAQPKGHRTTIVATFYQPDGRTPMEPSPTEVGLKLGTDGPGDAVGLAPSPGASKLVSRFASEPGPYPDAFRGTIVAKVGGESVEAPFNYR